MPNDDAIRAYARDIGVNPPIAGHADVQSALAAAVGAPSTFPVGPLDDTSTTYEITATGDQLRSVATRDTSGEVAAFAASPSAGNAGASVVANDNAGEDVELQLLAAAGTSTVQALINTVAVLTLADAKVGLYAATPVVQPIAIAAPAGGVTIDAEARTAIGLILTALGAAAGGIGITA